MSEREADLAIGVGPPGRFGASCRDRRHDGVRVPRIKWERVVVPSKQHRLQEDRKNPRRAAPRRGVDNFGLLFQSPEVRLKSTLAQLPLGRPALDSTIHYNTNPRSPFAVPAHVLS